MALPPIPLKDMKDFAFSVQEWFRQLGALVGSGSGALPWTSVSKSGANITDIPSRNHDSLQNISGGTPSQYYHLTYAQWARAAGNNLIVNNNASATYTIPAFQSMVYFTGTNVSPLTINFPAASSSLDSFTVVLVSNAAVASVTLNAPGASFQTTTTALVANTPVRYRYDHSTTKWYPC